MKETYEELAARKGYDLWLVHHGGPGTRADPNQCFYCKQKTGEYHKADCVSVNKKVRIRVSWDIEVTVPMHWTKEDIEFHRNEGSYCSDNDIERLGDIFNERAHTGCSCSSYECKYLGEVADATPGQ